MRFKFTGKPLLVKNRNGSLYQEKFYVRSKFRCKSVSQLCIGPVTHHYQVVLRIELVPQSLCVRVSATRKAGQKCS